MRCSTKISELIKFWTNSSYWPAVTMWFSFRVDQGAHWQFHWPTYTRPAGGSGSVCSQDFNNFVKCGLLSCQSTVGLSTGFDGGRGLSSTWSGTACLVLIQASRQINLTLTTAAWPLISSITCSPISEINSSRDRGSDGDSSEAH